MTRLEKHTAVHRISRRCWQLKRRIKLLSQDSASIVGFMAISVGGSSEGTSRCISWARHERQMDRSLASASAQASLSPPKLSRPDCLGFTLHLGVPLTFNQHLTKLQRYNGRHGSLILRMGQVFGMPLLTKMATRAPLQDSISHFG